MNNLTSIYNSYYEKYEIVKFALRYFRDLFGIPPDDFMVSDVCYHGFAFFQIYKFLQINLITSGCTGEVLLNLHTFERCKTDISGRCLFVSLTDSNLQRESARTEQPGRQWVDLLLDQG